MAHVVMCWELGGDLGHVARMRPLAEALRGRGHRVSFIVRETLAAGRLLDPAHYAWLQAPLQPNAVSPAYAPTLNFTQIMHNVGFHDHKAIVGRMHAWRNLYDALKPDLLVFDHSPTALLAARGLRVKRILLGTGFGIPPATEPLPPFDTETAASDLGTSEREVIARINTSLKTFGVEQIKRIADIYQADASLLFSLKELDHYPQRQNGDYWGPPAQGSGTRPDWPEGAGKRVFAYLKPFKTLPALLETLGQAAHRTLIYMSRQDGPRQAGSGNLRYADKPVNLVQAVKESDLVICHSGHGTISATLLGGRPLLLLPLNIEQRMLAARVAGMGAGLAAPALAPEGMREKFLRLLAEPAYTTAARAFAERYAGLEVEKNPERFAALAERLLGS
jgi:hypothetical protein